MFRFVVLIAAIVGFTSGADRATAKTLNEVFTGFFVLGDSLSDPGNLPNGQRFTDGRVWAEIIAEDFDKPGSSANFAVGGGRAIGEFGNDLDAQFATFKNAVEGSAVELGTRPLVAVWFGANDVFSIFPNEQRGGVVLVDPVEAARKVVTTIAQISSSLSVKDFLVFDLPDQGATPLAASTSTQGVLSQRSTNFNDALSSALNGLDASINTFAVPIADRFAQLLNDPSQLGLVDFSSPCTVGATNEAQRQSCAAIDPNAPPPATDYGFNDPVHPNSKVHEEIARVVEQTVIPLPAAAPLMISAFCLLVVLRRRRAVA